MAKVLIDKDKPLTRGDRVEMHFVSSGMASIKALQIALLEQRFKSRADWNIIRFQTPDEYPTLLILTIEILQETTVAVVADMIITSGIVFELNLAETFLLNPQAAREAVESPAVKVAVSGSGFHYLLAGIAIFVLLNYAK